MRRGLQVAEYVVEEEVGVRIRGISIPFRWADRRLAVVEDNDLIYAEDGACSCYSSSKCGLLFWCLDTDWVSRPCAGMSSRIAKVPMLAAFTELTLQ